MYTGHVTAGGSICLEALTNSGTAGSWQSDYSVESLINVIVINMVRHRCNPLFPADE
jgi:ubiquitin-conjugating enzyme E2 Q